MIFMQINDMNFIVNKFLFSFYIIPARSYSNYCKDQQMKYESNFASGNVKLFSHLTL